MGLSGPKNRIKIGQDPNNMEWTRDTTRFGHKILISQGWTPGSHLGAKDAAHSSHYTAANLSHIRVALKDDTLGLGAPKPRERAENFGLGIFGDVLSRLNGKSEDQIDEEVRERRDKALKLFASERWGSMVFVSGGLLVGDDIVKKDSTFGKELAKKGEVPPPSQKVQLKTSKKRKRSGEDEQEREKKEKREKKNKKAKQEESSSSSEESQEDTEKRSKKRKEKASKETKPAATSENESKEERRQRKEEKRRLKAEKKQRKEEKLAKKAAKKLLKASGLAEDSTESTSTTPSAASTSVSSPFPPSSGTSTPLSGGLVFNSGRYAARRRYVEAKKLASQDPKALREILMIKSHA